MVEVMGWKAVGAKLMDYSKSIEMEWEKNRKGQPATGTVWVICLRASVQVASPVVSLT